MFWSLKRQEQALLQQFNRLCEAQPFQLAPMGIYAESVFTDIMWFETAIVSGGGSSLATRLWSNKNLTAPLLQYVLGVRKTSQLHIAAQLCIECLRQQQHLLQDGLRLQNSGVSRLWHNRLQSQIAKFRVYASAVPCLESLCQAMLSMTDAQL